MSSENKKGAKSPLTLPWIAAKFIIYFPKEAKWATRIDKAVFLSPEINLVPKDKVHLFF